jgi:pimeloyl-ACP methyl ester carboxylesterase
MKSNQIDIFLKGNIVKRFFAALIMSALAAMTAATAQAQDKIGIVLMHGKQGMPMGRPPPMLGLQLINGLKDAGYLVATPEMCWSRRRGLDKPFADCMKEIDDVIADLKGQGANAFIVGGMSQGGLVAIAYGAEHPEIHGVLAYGPADDPIAKASNPISAPSIDKARQLAADGKGGEKASFDDANTGAKGVFKMTLDTTPDIYLSFYGPDAKTSIAANVARLKMPLLWVYGDGDGSQQRNALASFERAPQNPLNRQVQVPAHHLETPNAGREATLAWLKELK